MLYVANLRGSALAILERFAHISRAFHPNMSKPPPTIFLTSKMQEKETYGGSIAEVPYAAGVPFVILQKYADSSSTFTLP